MNGFMVMAKTLFLILISLFVLRPGAMAETASANVAKLEQLEFKVLSLKSVLIESKAQELKLHKKTQRLRIEKRKQVLEYELYNRSDLPAPNVKINALWAQVSLLRPKDDNYYLQSSKPKTVSLAPRETVRGTFESHEEVVTKGGSGPNNGTKIIGYNIRLFYQGEEQVAAADPKRLSTVRPDPNRPTTPLKE